jgi:chorismate mutase
MVIRGIRGAVQAEANTAPAILSATRRLLEEIVRLNGFGPEQIAAAFFTVTDDLDATFPAEAARELGWTQVPMLCQREIPVPGSMGRVVRALLLVNASDAAADVHHVYLGETQCLRPDLAEAHAEKLPGKRRGGAGATRKLRARLLGKSRSQESASPTPSPDEQP